MGHADLNFHASPDKNEVIHFMSVQNQRVLNSASLGTVVANFIITLIQMSWCLLLNFTSHDTFWSYSPNHERFTQDTDLNLSYMRHPFSKSYQKLSWLKWILVNFEQIAIGYVTKHFNSLFASRQKKIQIQWIRILSHLLYILCYFRNSVCVVKALIHSDQYSTR